MFQNYIFDLYGTLIDIKTDEGKKDLWEKMAIFYGYRKANYTPKELQQKYYALCGVHKFKAMDRHHDFTRVDIDITTVFRELYEFKGVECDRALAKHTANTFRCFSTEHIKLYDGVIDLLDTLKAKNKKIFLLSNAQTDFTRPELDMLGLTPYFDDMLISSEEECSKPDQHFIDMLFKKHNLKKSESVFIGNDFIADIKGAYDYGIHSLYIHQSISPPITQELKSNWKIMDGNVRKIKRLIVK